MICEWPKKKYDPCDGEVCRVKLLEDEDVVTFFAICTYPEHIKSFMVSLFCAQRMCLCEKHAEDHRKANAELLAQSNPDIGKAFRK